MDLCIETANLVPENTNVFFPIFIALQRRLIYHCLLASFSFFCTSSFLSSLISYLLLPLHIAFGTIPVTNYCLSCSGGKLGCQLEETSRLETRQPI